MGVPWGRWSKWNRPIAFNRKQNHQWASMKVLYMSICKENSTMWNTATSNLLIFQGLWLMTFALKWGRVIGQKDTNAYATLQLVWRISKGFMYQVYVRGTKAQITISPSLIKMKHYSALLLFLLFTVNDSDAINHDHILLRRVVFLMKIQTSMSSVIKAWN